MSSKNSPLKRKYFFLSKAAIRQSSSFSTVCSFCYWKFRWCIANILGIRNDVYVHQNSKNVSDEKKFLSELAYRNLKLYLKDDYDYLSKLLTMNTTSSTKENILLK